MSTAREIAILLGTAILLPLLIYYGVSTFSPAPKYEDYVQNTPILSSLSTEERAALIEKQKAQQAKLREAQAEFAFRLFWVAVPVGILALLGGGLLPVSGFAAGLMFGGLLCATCGFAFNWQYVPDWEHFAALAAMAAVLIAVAFQKSMRGPAKPLAG